MFFIFFFFLFVSRSIYEYRRNQNFYSQNMIKFVCENNGNHKWCMNLHEEIVFVYVVDKIYEYEKNTRVFVEKSRNIFLKVVFNIFRTYIPGKASLFL